MHVHLTSDPRYSGYRALEFTDNFGTVVGVANAKRTLEAGFTTVRNVGSDRFDDVALKQGIEQGYVPGPRIVPATYAIGATGGHCDYTEFPPSITTPTTAIANGPEELRAMVRKLRKYGAEVIKFCGTGAVLSKTDVAGDQQYSLEVMKAIVDEAHRLGLKSVTFVMKGGVVMTQGVQGALHSRRQGKWDGSTLSANPLIAG